MNRGKDPLHFVPWRIGRVARPAWRRLGLALVVAVAANAAAQDKSPFPPALVKQGATLYAANCESCHGVRMVGPQWGIDLKTFPRDNPARFIDSVTYGARNMPPWGDVLKPDEIKALWAYVSAGEP